MISVYTTDRDLRYTWILNPSRGFWDGCAPDASLGGLPPIEGFPELIALERHVLETERGERQRIAAMVGEEEHVYDVTVIPLCASDGTVSGLTVSTLDVTDLVGAERAARAARDFSENLFAIAGVIFLVMDQEARVRTINRKGCELLGCSEAEAIGADWIGTFIPARHRAQLRGVFQAVLTGHPEVSEYHENPVLDRRGRERIVAWHSRVLRDSEGRFKGVLSTGEDVTERVQTLEALTESEIRFRGTFENAAVGIAHVGLDGGLLRVNQRLCEIIGYSREELLRRTIQDITHPDDLEPDLLGSQRLIADEITSHARERRYLRKDGTSVWVKVTESLARRADGTPDYFIVIVDDVSDRRQTETQTKLLATVVETSSDFIGVASLEGKALYLNHAGQELVGLADDAAVATTRIEDYLFPDDLPLVRETVMPAVMREGRWIGELRFRHFQTGEPIPVRWDLVRIDDPTTGEPIRLATVTRDIRKEKAVENALLEADRRKDEFLAVLGHELRNPMAPIRSAVEIMQHLCPAEPRVQWALEVLDRQTTHMRRLLDDLLDVSRIVHGQLKLRRRPVKITEILRQAADGVAHLMDERRHHFTVEPAPEDVVVDADPLRLSQVLLNLLANAVNYTDEGGEIRLSAEATASDVVLRVRDNGRGIPPDLMQRMFDAFAQGKRRVLNGEYCGLGLGLTIARRLAQLHGGQIEATSEGPGQGSEFSIRLPRMVRPTPKPTETRKPSEATNASLRVLVVDDSADVANSMALVLRLMGHEVKTALSGAEALEIARRFRPRLALLDIAMPSMDGLELARRLREEHVGEGIRIIALTGYGHEEAVARSLAAGFDEHLVKPVDGQMLRTVLAKIA